MKVLIYLSQLLLVGELFPASPSSCWEVEGWEAITALEKEVVATLAFPVQMITWVWNALEFWSSDLQSLTTLKFLSKQTH